MMEFSVSIHVEHEPQISVDVGPNPAEDGVASDTAEAFKKQKKKSVPPVQKSKFGRTKTGGNKKSTRASNPVSPPQNPVTPPRNSTAAITPPGINTNGMSTAQLKRKVRDDHRTKAKANYCIANLELKLVEMERTLLEQDERIKTLSREKQDDKKSVNNVSILFLVLL